MSKTPVYKYDIGDHVGVYEILSHGGNVKNLKKYKVKCTLCGLESFEYANKLSSRLCTCEKTFICKECGETKTRINRKIAFCSQSCGTNYKNKNAYLIIGKKICKTCGVEFNPINKHHVFCCESCKGKWKYVVGNVNTFTQYKQISGNWYKYFQRLLQHQRGVRKRPLSIDDLLFLLKKQEYRCALSGEPLTCTLERGKKCLTNASIDRIIPGSDGGLYTRDNIQLVCIAVNSWRSDMAIENYIGWCRKIVDFNSGIKNE